MCVCVCGATERDENENFLELLCVVEPQNNHYMYVDYFSTATYQEFSGNIICEYVQYKVVIVCVI